jgi:hypothetical protein
MWTYYRKWGRYRRQPLVLAPLALAIGALFGAEVVRNTAKRICRSRRARRTWETLRT